MKQSQQDYEKLHQLSRHAHLLSGVTQLLEWDQETYMPSDAGAIRGEQVKTLAGVIHKEKTSKTFSSALNQLIDLKTGVVSAKDLSSPQKASLKYWRRDYIKDTALPSTFVEEFAQLTSQSQLVWRKAKEENGFHHFAPFLDKIVSMCRKKADLLGFEEHPYDALLDIYEPDMKTKEISKVFLDLKKPLTALLKTISSRPQVDDSFLFGSFNHDKQLSFGKRILKDMGYPESRGRLDLSTHPFSCSFHPTDCRITTRIHPKGLMTSISGVLHEAGHALYEMGLPAEHYGSPLAEPISHGIHESQSRWWETRIGLSKPFWEHYFPLLKEQFKGKFDHIELESFYQAINKVEPSLIRVEADEVTYPLHIILRFELERDIIDGTLPIRDIPEAWNAKMKELLGITPKDNREGCLQDIHWSMGGFGYFPSYALGNLYASQLFEAFQEKHSNWQSRLKKGELLFVKTWLNENVHQYGRQYNTKELLKKVTGKPFSASAYITYLEHKYK